jgi:hypothetical protein
VRPFELAIQLDGEVRERSARRGRRQRAYQRKAFAAAGHICRGHRLAAHAANLLFPRSFTQTPTQESDGEADAPST